MVRFSVTVEDNEGNTVLKVNNIPAQTKQEAINRAKQSLTWSAEREIVKVVEVVDLAKVPASNKRTR